MIVIRNFLFEAVAAQAFAFVPISLAPILAAKAVDREAVSVDAETAQARKRGFGGEGVMTKLSRRKCC